MDFRLKNNFRNRAKFIDTPVVLKLNGKVGCVMKVKKEKALEGMRYKK